MYLRCDVPTSVPANSILALTRLTSARVEKYGHRQLLSFSVIHRPQTRIGMRCAVLARFQIARCASITAKIRKTNRRGGRC